MAHKVRTYKEYHSVCPSSELGLPPTPHPLASVPPPPCFWGEGNTRWRERGWESPNSDEGRTLWYSLYVRTLWCGLYFQVLRRKGKGNLDEQRRVAYREIARLDLLPNLRRSCKTTPYHLAATLQATFTPIEKEGLQTAPLGPPR